MEPTLRFHAAAIRSVQSSSVPGCTTPAQLKITGKHSSPRCAKPRVRGWPRHSYVERARLEPGDALALASRRAAASNVDGEHTRAFAREGRVSPPADALARRGYDCGVCRESHGVSPARMDDAGLAARAGFIVMENPGRAGGITPPCARYRIFEVP